jgi:hypothetical protein
MLSFIFVEMDDLLIALFLFSAGMFLVMILGKRSAEHALSFLETIRLYAVGILFILGSVFVLMRFLYGLF